MSLNAHQLKHALKVKYQTKNVLARIANFCACRGGTVISVSIDSDSTEIEEFVTQFARERGVVSPVARITRGINAEKT